MSYCRFSDNSDIYLFDNISGGWECCNCYLGEGGKATNLETRTETIKHLLKHKDAGHKVPTYSIERLVEELREGGDFKNKKENE